MKKVYLIIIFLILVGGGIILNHRQYNYVMEEIINKTLEVAYTSGNYNENFYDYYLKIEYLDKEDFIKEINVFLEKKYSPDEINNIYQNFKSANINKLLKNDYLNLSDFFSIKNFDVDNYSRYVNWEKEDVIDLQTIVTYVNVGLDKEFYSFYDEISEPDNYAILINKYHKLPTSYEPNDLVSLSYDAKYQLRRVAAENFERLVNDAKNKNHFIAPYSAYRSYERQRELYTGYIRKDGQKKADTYSARPGFSEHQSGLAVDITTIGNINQLNKEDYIWVNNNCHKYGFIIRYPQNKIDITGYMYEDWHLRYVGVEIATAVNKTNLTFDEYYDLFLKEY